MTIGGTNIYYSKDGGEDWKKSEIKLTKQAFGITHSSIGHAWIVGASGLILRSTSQGINWGEQPNANLNTLYGIAFAPGGDIGWAVGDNGTILKTTSGSAAAPGKGIWSAMRKRLPPPRTQVSTAWISSGVA